MARPRLFWPRWKRKGGREVPPGHSWRADLSEPRDLPRPADLPGLVECRPRVISPHSASVRRGGQIADRGRAAPSDQPHSKLRVDAPHSNQLNLSSQIRAVAKDVWGSSLRGCQPRGGGQARSRPGRLPDPEQVSNCLAGGSCRKCRWLRTSHLARHSRHWGRGGLFDRARKSRRRSYGR